MSGFNPYGSPQYPPPQGQMYPQLPGQPGQPGFPPNPQFPYQPQPGMPGSYPAAMSYAGAPSAPAPAPGFGYPNVTPIGYPTGQPTGYPAGVQPAGYPAGGHPAGYPTVTPTSVATVEWIPSSPQSAAQLSDRAVVAGYEGHDGSPLWVIRSHFESDQIPGKLAVKHHSAYVPWGGIENSVHSFEVCCASPNAVRWVEGRDGAVPPNAIPAGRTSSGETLYVGRVRHEGSLTPGKVHPSHKAMYISFAGQEIPHKRYEVLCTA